MVDRDFERLLNAIVAGYAIVDEQKDIDLNAPSTDPGSELDDEKVAAAQRMQEKAAELGDAFETGLKNAAVQRAAGNPELVLDDRDPVQNRIADAMIGFLVRYDLAESSSVETEPMHYAYHIGVNWDRLEEVARGAGLDLAAMTAAA